MNGAYFQLIETKFLGFPPRRRPVSPSCVLGTEAMRGWGKAHWKVTIGASTWRSEKRHKLSSKHSWTFTMPGKVGGCMVNQNYGKTKTHPPVPPPYPSSHFSQELFLYMHSNNVRFCLTRWTFFGHPIMNEEICPSSTVGEECNRVLVTCLFVYSYMTASPPPWLGYWSHKQRGIAWDDHWSDSSKHPYCFSDVICCGY